MTRIRKVLTFSNVVACLALFMALGGTVYAAGKISGTQIKPKSIPGNRLKASAVATNQLKAKAVTAAKVKPGSLTGTQIKAGSLTGTQINQTTLTGVSAASLASVFYVTAKVTAPSGGTPFAGTKGTANCPAGTYVIGGGATLSNTEESGDNSSAPTSSHTGWEATLYGEEGTSLTITAICTAVKTVG